jgi:predicted ABC-type ATPase
MVSSLDSFVLLMGSPGAGKSTVLEHYCSRKMGKGALVTVVSPDAHKEKLAKYHELKAAGISDAASRIHEESIQMAVLEFNACLEEPKTLEAKRVIVFDGTGSWMPFCEKLISAAEKAGFVIKAIFVDAHLEICKERAIKRCEETGRSVPASAIERTYHNVHANFAFLIKTRLHKWKAFDNSGPKHSHSLIARKSTKKPSSRLPLSFAAYFGDLGDSIVKSQWDEHRASSVSSASSTDLSERDESASD